MKIADFLRKALPYIVAVVVFWAVSALYFAPQFSGKTLQMTDVQMYEGMKKDISDHRSSFDEDPQWTGGMFGGMPAYLITVDYPAMIIRNAAGWLTGLTGEPASLMFVAMLGFWLMLLMAGVNPWVAIPAALAYGLSTYNILIIEAGHITKMRAMGYAPMLVGAVIYTFRGRPWLGGALAALFGALAIAASHPQITYYFLLVAIAFWINELVVTVRRGGWPRFGKATAILAAAAVLAVGANFTHLWYTAGHTPDTTRGGSEVAVAGEAADGGLDLEYATAWSYGIGESVNMFIPDFRGGASSEGFETGGRVAGELAKYGIPQMASQLPAYWGEQPFTGGPTYIGAVVVFLFVLGMFVLPGRKKWWVAAVSLVGLLLAWGNNAMWFTELSFAALPGYNKFRTVAMALAILQWSVPFVAALVLSELWKGGFAETAGNSKNRVTAPQRRFTKGFWWSLGITGGGALFVALFGGMIFDFASSSDFGRLYNFALQGGLDKAGAETFAGNITAAMATERWLMMRADCWRSLAYVLLTAAVVWGWVSLRGVRRWAMTAAVGVLVLCDLVPIGLRYLSHDHFVTRSRIEIKPDAADRAIMADTEPGFRVLNTANPFNEAYTSYFHRSVGGYHGAKLGRYQDIIDRYLSKFDAGVLDMLNTKYFIVADPATGVRRAELNPGANGAAWFVDTLFAVDGAQAELEALATIDSRREAVVDARFAEAAKIAPPARTDTLPQSAPSIELVEYRPNYLRYETSSPDERVAVFSEIYYDKGWKAYLDGVEASCFRADYILRAMVVPRGAHTIEWRFRAPRFALVEGVTLGCSIAILLWLAAAVTVDLRRKKITR